jgi:hypothetical protein
MAQGKRRHRVGDVVFSDEKKFNLDEPDGFHYYWKDLRRPPRRYVTRQAGGGLVIVWACFSPKGKSEIAFLVGRQKSEDYIFTLSEYLLPFAHLHYGIEFLFLQDNASIHTSQETRAWMRDNNVSLLDWSARSPDLNPIESQCRNTNPGFPTQKNTTYRNSIEKYPVEAEKHPFLGASVYFWPRLYVMGPEDDAYRDGSS